MNGIVWKRVRIIRQILLLVTFCSTTIYMMADGGALGKTKLMIGFILAITITIIFLILPSVEILLLKKDTKKEM